MNIYVVGTRTEGSGGFEWRLTREDGEQAANEALRLAYLSHKMKERFEVTSVRKIEVPPEIAARYEQATEQITNWLDSDADLWEPPGDDVPTVTFKKPVSTPRELLESVAALLEASHLDGTANAGVYATQLRDLLNGEDDA